MAGSKLQFSEYVENDDCPIGSDRRSDRKMCMDQSQSSAVISGSSALGISDSIDFPQMLHNMAGDLGNPQYCMDKEKNVQYYLEKLDDRLKYQELMMLDMFKAIRKMSRRGARVPAKQDEQGRTRASGLENMAGTNSQTESSNVSGGRNFFGYSSQTLQARKRQTVQENLVPKLTRLPTEALTTSSSHRNIWRFMEDRNSGPGAMFTAACLTLTVLSNAALLFWDAVYSLDDGVMWPLVVCHLIFVIEFLVRFRVAPSRTLFMCNTSNLFEMICLGVFSACFVNRTFAEKRWHGGQQPFYGLWLFLPALMMMRAVRRFKIFVLLSSALKVALEVLPVLLYSLGIIIASFAAIISAVEPKENIASYTEALWLVIVTVFTVGYGDYAPASGHGRLACSMLMAITCLYMAIPIGIVGTAFHNVWEDKDRLMALQDLRDQISWAGLGVEDALNTFEMSTEGNMECGVSLEAFKGILLGLQCEWDDDVIRHVFNVLDGDGCGSLDIDEFLFGLFPMQRFFWKQAVEKIKKDGPSEKIQCILSGVTKEKVEEDEGHFRPKQPEVNPEDCSFRPNRPENDPKYDSFRTRGAENDKLPELSI